MKNVVNENQKHVNSIVEELNAIYNGEVMSEENEDCTMDFFEYFADVLDIKYIIGSDRKSLDGVKLLVAFGGPNIWLIPLKEK